MMRLREMWRWGALALALSLVTPALALDERSVSPGINRQYENPDVDQWLSVFEREGREVYDRRADILARLGLREGMSVADIGAGTGLFTLPFAQVVGPQGKVYAVDISVNFVDAIRARARAAGLDQVEGIVNSARSVELPDASIDLAFISDTYHHFEFPLSTMTSLFRAMRSGGELVVIDYKRVPGESSPWVLSHLRAGKETFIDEIVAVGFVLIEDVDFMQTQYFLRFRKPAEPELSP
ncbi:MAG: methyltransferase domain-containing protein [Thiotrichales bacterium]